LGPERDFTRGASFEHFGRPLNGLHVDAHLGADRLDVEARLSRVALEGNSLEVHEKARNASVRTLDDAAQRLFEHRNWRLVPRPESTKRFGAESLETWDV